MTNEYRGFTLVEMMISLFIVSVAVVFAAFVTGTIKATRNSALENAAFRIAESKLNELRGGGYAALPASGPFTDPELTNLPQGAASTTVTVVNAKMKQVETGVSWASAGGAERYVSLTTFIADSGGL